MAKVVLPLDEDILPPSEDYVFKAMLTSADAKPVLADLISAVIGRTVVSVELRNNELPVSDVEEKNERLDVNCVIDDGSLVEVEMQGTRLEELPGSKDNIINKMLYYATDLYSSQQSKGVVFRDLKRAYQITFSKHTIFPKREKYITYGNMRDEDGELITDQLSMITVELSKLGDILKTPVDDMKDIDMWAAFVGYADDPEKRELINKIIERKEAIGVAGEVIMGISRNPDEWAKLRSRRKIESMRMSDLATVEERGRREGEARGIAQGMREMARNLKNGGVLPIEEIAEAAGLSVAEVKAL